jgi:putative ABC transport system permease protein
MGIPLIAGREFNAGDRADASPVAIVSAEMGKLFWPGESAIGHRFKLGWPAAPLMTVVGVAGEIRSRGFQDTPEPTMYIPLAQTRINTGYMPREMSMVIRTAGDPMALATALRNQVRALDPVVPVSELRTLEEVVGTSVTTRRFSTALLVLFAAVALTLAGIGTYGVISYSVSQRTFEIGVRMALGAERQSVLALVMSEGLRMSVVGLAIGLAGSVVVARAIRAMLVGVSVVDLPALALASGLLVVVAVLASALPARRASAVSPTEALRGD